MLSLRSLNHLAVLARRLNYVRAADELGISQPALTRSIQKLERQLHVTLFDRDRGKVSLTLQGRMIAERASAVLAQAEELEYDAALSGQVEIGRVRFGMAPMPARALLQNVLGERLMQAPDVTNEVVVRDVEPLWDMLVGGEIEFFVSPNAPLRDLSRADVKLLGIFPLSLIVRAGHPLLSDPSSDARFPLVRSSWSGVSVPPEFQNRIRGAPNVIEDFGALASLAASTDVLWLSSPSAIQQEMDTGSLVELTRARERIELTLYSLSKRASSPLAAKMIDALEKWARVLASPRPARQVQDQ